MTDTPVNHSDSAPAWIDAEMPYNGPCAFCADEAGARHRVLDSIAEGIRAGDSTASVAEDFGVSVGFAERVAKEWK